MKVTITKESGRWMTVDELPYAKQIVQDLKDDSFAAKDYAEMAADAIMWARYNHDSVRRVIEASAEICRDNRIEYNQFGDGCGHLGVWVNFTAETFHGFLKVGCLLSDVWALGTDEARAALIRHSYIRYYTEQE